MNTMRNNILIILSISVINAYAGEKAVVIVPVADLIGQPISDFFKNRPIAHAYYMLPWWPGKNTNHHACPRLHQLIFNEIVEVLKVQGQEVLIRIPHVFYITSTIRRPQTDYWTLKKNIMPLFELEKHGIDPSIIPDPIDFQNTDLAICHRNTVTLTHPFHDPITNQTFSAGTRFVVSPQQSIPHKITVLALDPRTKMVKTVGIDKKRARIYENHSIDQRIKDFVDLLSEWAHANSIPYVWGGCSFVNTHHPDSCHERTATDHDMIPQLENNPPKTGFDCSGIVARAAQTVGIPYFFKNTYTLAQSLTPVGPGEHARDGDLIWIRGHVMVVSNRAKNLMIEARSYDGGYGKVHEIALRNVFKDIKTYADLEKAIAKKQPLKRLNLAGAVSDTFDECKLLKIRSVWKS